MNIKKKIFIACDHVGFEIIKQIITYFDSKSFLVVDCGASKYDKNDDFPDFMHDVGYNVSKDPTMSLGVVLGGSGVGESALLNRYPMVRCGILFGKDIEMVKNGREHDNINAVAIGVRFTKVDDIMKGLDCFIETPFLSEVRFVRRIGKIENMRTTSDLI